MKKFLCLLSVFVVAGTSAAMAGCSSDKSEGSLGLSYGKEYIYSYYDRWHEIERSVVFDKDGTGKYREKQTAKQDDFDNWNYTVSFRYLYYAEEDTVFCFYDSVEYGEEPEDADEVIGLGNEVFMYERIVASNERSCFRERGVSPEHSQL